MSSAYIAVKPRPDQVFDVRENKVIGGIVKGFHLHIRELGQEHKGIINISPLCGGYGLVVEPDFEPDFEPHA